jgi:hypothetical protein
MPNKMYRVQLPNRTHPAVRFAKASFWKLFAKLINRDYNDKEDYFEWLTSTEVYTSERSPDLLQEATDFKQWLYAYAREVYFL